MTPSKNKRNPLETVLGLVGAAVGWGFSKYAGVMLFIPAAAMLLLLLLFAKTPVRPRFFRGALSITGGHFVWFLVACALSGQWLLMTPDLVLLSAGIAWLWLRPSLLAALFLGILQVASLGLNVYSITSVPVGSLEHRALTVHCLFRVLSLVALGVGYHRMRKEQAGSAELEASSSLA